MLFLVFYFLLAAILIFQGLHLAAEVKSPLGTVPEEVAQKPAPSLGWGRALMGLGTVNALVALAGFQWERLVALRSGLFTLGWVALALYGCWVISLGRKAEFMGTPAVTDDHGHH